LVLARIAVALGLLLLSPRAAEADELRVATLAPEGSAWMNILEETAKALSDATEQRVELKLYGGGAQGDERDVIRKIKLEQLDGAVLTSVGLSLIYPGIRVLELPFMFESVEEVDYVRGKMWKHFVDKFAEKGFILAAHGDVGWSYVYTNRPIKSKADVPKVKIWAWQDDPIVRALYKRVELNGVPLGVPDVLPALESGRIDACYGPPLAAVALQWYTKVTNATSMPVAYSMGAVVFRAEPLDELADKDRTTLDEIAEDLGTKLVKRVRKDNERALKAMVKAGISIDTTPPALATWFEREARGVWKDLAGTVYTEEELETVLKYRDEYRAKQKKKRGK
jgi:TRAP-type C4-dicarboxylate transport system substrate-binding protein